MKDSKDLLRGWGLAGLLWQAAVAHGAEPLNLDTLISPAGITQAVVSPDGKHVAAIAYNGLKYHLMLGDADTLKFKTIYHGQAVTDGWGYHHKSPTDVLWLGDDLLAVNFTFRAGAMNLSGKLLVDLGEDLIGRVKDDDPYSTTVLSYSDMEESVIARIDARTGRSKKFSFPMDGRPASIAFDSRGEPRAVSMVSDKRRGTATRSNWYKASASAEWVKLAEFQPGEEAWLPMYVPDEPHTIVVKSRLERDTYAIFEYDTDKKALGTMMAGSPEVDIREVDGLDRNFRRVTTNGMKPQQIWFDSEWSGLQASVDLALPNRINRLSGYPKKKIVIYSWSDVDPGSWYLLDTEAKTLRRFGRRIESVDPAQMQPMQPVSYAARDGLRIPAFLTLPAGGSKGLPAVVLVHGGPVSRDWWGWDMEVQALASRGYAVLQPQFRGSSGFGRKFQEAGYRQWGLAMQDDVSDGVDYLVKQGIADPARICIFGTSYGGYAALDGLMKTPALFKCGISFAGISDLELWLTGWSDANDLQFTRDWMTRTIGDLKTSKAQFEAVSPLKNVDRIKAPVLLMHANLDERVPIEHSTKMRDALQRAGKRVEWEEFPLDGHGLSQPRNLKRYLELVTGFLRKHIGDGTHPPE